MNFFTRMTVLSIFTGAMLLGQSGGWILPWNKTAAAADIEVEFSTFAKAHEQTTMMPIGETDVFNFRHTHIEFIAQVNCPPGTSLTCNWYYQRKDDTGKINPEKLHSETLKIPDSGMVIAYPLSLDPGSIFYPGDYYIELLNNVKVVHRQNFKVEPAFSVINIRMGTERDDNGELKAPGVLFKSPSKLILELSFVNPNARPGISRDILVIWMHNETKSEFNDKFAIEGADTLYFRTLELEKPLPEGSYMIGVHDILKTTVDPQGKETYETDLLATFRFDVIP